VSNNMYLHVRGV